MPGELVPQPGVGALLLVCPSGYESFWRALVDRVDRPQLAEVRNYTARTFAIKDVAALINQLMSPAESGPESPPRIVADELTGTLIVSATPAQHARVAELLARLEATPVGAASRVRSFVIRNRPVREVAESLSRLMAVGVLGTAALLPDVGVLPRVTDSLTDVPPNPAVPGAAQDRLQANIAPQEAGAPQRARESPNGATGAPTLRLTTDEGLNALIVVGEPRDVAQVEELLKTLDVRQSQVRLEVMLVSMTESQTRQLGVELDKFGSIDGSAVRLSSIFGATPTPSGLLAVPGIGFTGSILNPGDFTVLVRAFEALNDGRAVSSPHLLVGNNQQATFTSVSQQPTTTTSTNSTSTTITSFGGFQDAGTKIAVKPQIAEGDHLILQYDIELSSFTGKGTAGLPAPRQQNSISSVATIPDGFTVVVGGLELANESTDVQQVPLIGDIPVVGELFKTRTTGNDKTRFWVFIRANVLRDASFEDLKYASSNDARKADVDDGWPKVKPRIVK